MTDVDPIVAQVSLGSEIRSLEEAALRIQQLEWIVYQLRERTGGDTDSIEELMIGELYESGIVTAAISELESNMQDEITHVNEVQYWHKKRVNSNTYATDFGIYSVRSGKKIYLPDYPNTDSQVIIINEDGNLVTVDGNDRNIKVRKTKDTSVSWSEAGTAIHFHWFEEGPWWIGV